MSKDAETRKTQEARMELQEVAMKTSETKQQRRGLDEEYEGLKDVDDMAFMRMTIKSIVRITLENRLVLLDILKKQLSAIE